MWERVLSSFQGRIGKLTIDHLTVGLLLRPLTPEKQNRFAT